MEFLSSLIRQKLARKGFRVRDDVPAGSLEEDPARFLKEEDLDSQDAGSLSGDPAGTGRFHLEIL
ncbi:MAG: hypothetical protein JWM14_32 [Chitinophagaceae bacterium]|nr:hypothetical protein [Chitinophagaceae bacterium]